MYGSRNVIDAQLCQSRCQSPGLRLPSRLKTVGLVLRARLWLDASEDDRWYFYVVSPLVDSEGPAQAYRRLHPLVRAMAQPFRIDALTIKLIGPGDPLAKDVTAIHKRAPGPRVSPIRFGGRRMGNVSIEGAYLYPIAASAPTWCIATLRGKALWAC